MVDVKREATCAHAVDGPEHLVAEILDGELVLSPHPAPGHASVASYLGAELIPQFCRRRDASGSRGWVILHEPELHLGQQVVIPDLAGWRRERLPVLPDAAYLTLPPDWVCEIASKSTEKLDRRRKLPLYAAVGVGHAWLVHPRLRTIEVLCNLDGKWLNLAVYGDDEQIRAAPFEAHALELATLWADLPSRASEPAAEYGNAAR